MCEHRRFFFEWRYFFGRGNSNLYGIMIRK